MSIYAVFSSFSKQDFRLLYHKCALLQSQDRVDEFVEAGIELFKLFFNDVYHNKDLMGRRSSLWCSVLCFSFYSPSLLPFPPLSLPSSCLPPSFPSLLLPSSFLLPSLPSSLPSLPPSLSPFLPSVLLPLSLPPFPPSSPPPFLLLPTFLLFWKLLQRWQFFRVWWGKRRPAT